MTSARGGHRTHPHQRDRRSYVATLALTLTLTLTACSATRERSGNSDAATTATKPPPRVVVEIEPLPIMPAGTQAPAVNQTPPLTTAVQTPPDTYQTDVPATAPTTALEKISPATPKTDVPITTPNVTVTTAFAAGKVGEFTGELPPNERAATLQRDEHGVPAAVTGNGPGTGDALTEILRGYGDPFTWRWGKQEVTVRLHGSPTFEDVKAVEEFIADASTVPGTPRLLLAAGTPDADIEVHFAPRNQWNNVLGSEVNLETASGYAQPRGRNSVLREVVIVVGIDTSQVARNRTIAHELLHGIGLFGHTTCPSALLYGSLVPGGTLDPSVVREVSWRMSRYDRVLLESWYATTGEPVAIEELPCAPVFWRRLLYKGGTVLCEGRTGACYPADQVGSSDLAVTESPLPGRTPVVWYLGGRSYAYDPTKYAYLQTADEQLLCTPRNTNGVAACHAWGRIGERPDRWHDGTHVYRHNPETHTATLLLGKRLLCEKRDAGRAPCQFTSGSEVTRAEIYADATGYWRSP